MGYAGGLWVLRNENQISLRVIEDTFQEIHALVDVNGSPIALVSFVYGSPSRDRRKILWENLVNLSTVHNLPWLVGGDFNEILSPDEKWGVRDASLTRINDFQNCIDACGLTDLGALWDLKPFKAAGVDGCQLGFFQSKILVKRLKPIIASAVSFNQGASILDALQLFGFPSNSLKLIHSCISSVKHQILKNGKLTVKKALGLFLDISGLSVNESKSSIWFSPNNENDFILRTLPFRCSPKPGTYLGFPLCSGTKKRDFSEIVKRIKDKVESWKAHLLSKPWRVTLIKSIRKNSSANSQVQLDINVNSYFRFALMRAAEFSHLTVNDNNNDVFKAPVLVSSISPPAGWWKINIDGSCTSLSNIIATGGIVRDYCAEGSKIIVESNSLAVITLINDFNTPTSHHFFLSSRVVGFYSSSIVVLGGSFRVGC
ncbi:uncharacterized protein G2W53_033557 [Senna tora]|uniref:Endonuclease/exonuclease/phosphatase domain-containing protein n=1 Tax=Senna tora TaxID=362788 RepID=A0A834T1G9_9FABA|nr:uncharacterized protein G2W53_033557 [Senna tora]